MGALKCYVCGANATLHRSSQFSCPSHWTGSRVDWQPIAAAIPKGTLLTALHEIESKLPALLTTPAVWSTLDVNYEPPHVERLWLQYDEEYRVYLHRIHPCTEALYHPHPWPSAIHIISGVYEMGVGYGVGNSEPPTATTLVLREGAEYEMIDRDGWHNVRPLSTVYSVMVTGKPWNRWSPSPTMKLGPLTPQVRNDLLAEFRFFFRPQGPP